MAMAAMPAFADIATDNENPICDSTTIGTTSGSTSLDAVWNIVNPTCSAGQYFDMTTATCVTCSANSYCPGGTYNVESQTNGLNSCPNNYALSASGAGAQSDCYRTCTTADVAHSETVSGGYYYGDNNQCGATSCAAGWHLKSGLNLANELSNVNNVESLVGAINSNGTYEEWSNLPQSESGLNQPNTWITKFDGVGSVYGMGRCSKTQGTKGLSSGETWANVTKFDTLTDETGQNGAQYCYCNITGYKPADGNLQSLSSLWFFYQDADNADDCGSACSILCADGILWPVIRNEILNSVQPIQASCEANTINITWYNEGSVHDENTCTYAESVTLPETDPQRTGYNFTGWTVRPASTPNQ